ncbi:MAG: DUF565 domain-containing protein [Cyanobacteria bacterium P01_A01_bin.84]
MQNTRLNSLFGTIANRARQWFFNPWRRISLLIICFLSGFFLGTAISTIAGQDGTMDIAIAAILVVFTEAASRIFYRRSWVERRALWVELLNSLKIGFTYSLFVEAFKLGS